GLRLARHRLVRGRGADRVRFRAAAGLRAHHGGDVRGAQSRHRRPLRGDRSARENPGMSGVAASPQLRFGPTADSACSLHPCGRGVVRVGAALPDGATPNPPPQGGGEPAESAAPPRIKISDPTAGARPNTGLTAALRHARYILGENTVTAFAFALFLL